MASDAPRSWLVLHLFKGWLTQALDGSIEKIIDRRPLPAIDQRHSHLAVYQSTGVAEVVRDITDVLSLALRKNAFDDILD